METTARSKVTRRTLYTVFFIALLSYILVFSTRVYAMEDEGGGSPETEQGGGDDIQSGGDDVQSGGDDIQSGGDDVQSGGDDIQSGGDDVQLGGDDIQSGGDDVRLGGDDVQLGGDDIQPGGDDVQLGGDDIQQGGDDVRLGGDDVQLGGDDNQLDGDDDQNNSNRALLLNTQQNDMGLLQNNNNNDNNSDNGNNNNDNNNNENNSNNNENNNINNSNSNNNENNDNNNGNGENNNNVNTNYDYDATLYDPTPVEEWERPGGEYPGVYRTDELTPNPGATSEQAPTIGIPSIADQNLPDKPTTESPAIIQGAAVGYEEKVGAVEYNVIKERVSPYSDYRYNIMEETAPDGTVHKKLTGFDQTYVIVRLDVSQFFDSTSNTEGSTDNNSENQTGDTSGSDSANDSASDSGSSDKLLTATDTSNDSGSSSETKMTATQYLHVRQDQNLALIPGCGIIEDEGGKTFTDQLGSRTSSYSLDYLLSKAKNVVDAVTGAVKPYVDILVYATSKNVAGADAGKENTPNGDISVQMYVDDVDDYNPDLKYDPMSTDPQHHTNCLAKFFDTAKAAVNTISRYLVKGSDLALEVSVDNSAGENKDKGTTFWSLAKGFENAYYDQEEDKSPTDPGCGRTLKLISEVAVTDSITLIGQDENNLKKRTLNVNSFDVQIANNTSPDQQTYTDGFTLQNGWLTLEDKSNTTGAEMAIGNNAKFVIDNGGKLIIDATCQLEIEWDGATTTPAADGTVPPADVLNNGILDLRSGGTIENNGIITIEGFEGKPYQPGAGQQASESEKGCGEMTINPGATITNNGSFVVYGRLYNLGTLINNGRYNDVIASNDPDKGVFNYHKGIQITWKDDVTQQNVYPGALYNGQDKNGNIFKQALLLNNGDILLAPGSIDNYGTIYNGQDSHIYLAAGEEAIIPIEPTPEAPTVESKRITLDPPKGSVITNHGVIINNGRIEPASVALNDNTSFGELTVPGNHPEMFTLNDDGTIINNNYIYVHPVNNGDSEDSGSNDNKQDNGAAANNYGVFRIVDGVLVCVLPDGTIIRPTADADGNLIFVMPDGTVLVAVWNADGYMIYILSDGTVLRLALDTDGTLVYIMPDGTVLRPVIDVNGNHIYSYKTKTGATVTFTLTREEADAIVKALKKANKA